MKKLKIRQQITPNTPQDVYDRAYDRLVKLEEQYHNLTHHKELDNITGGAIQDNIQNPALQRELLKFYGVPASRAIPQATPPAEQPTPKVRPEVQRLAERLRQFQAEKAILEERLGVEGAEAYIQQRYDEEARRQGFIVDTPTPETPTPQVPTPTLSSAIVPELD